VPDKRPAQLAEADPVTDYLSHLLSDQGEVRGQSVNWDNLLSDAVRRGHLEDALNSSTLLPGFAPISLVAAGQGTAAEQRTQLFHLLHHVSVLPPCKLRSYILASADPLLGEAVLK
tara:strand:- start:49 stop:396 length:348 start_codon:yes stop_codon:yes gene_type:complete